MVSCPRHTPSKSLHIAATYRGLPKVLSPMAVEGMLALALVVALAFPQLAQAGWLGTHGEESFAFLGGQRTITQRALSEAGGAGLAGLEGLWGNPAALSLSKPMEGQFGVALDGWGGRTGDGSLLLRSDSLTLAIGMAYSDLGTVAEMDVAGNATGIWHHPGSMLATAALAGGWGPWRLGWATSLASDRIANDAETALGWSMDLGLIQLAQPRSLRWGAGLRRWGRQEQGYVAGAGGGWTDAELYTQLWWRPLSLGRLQWNFELAWPGYSDALARVGLAWSLHRSFELQAGTRIDAGEAIWAWDQVAGRGSRTWEPTHAEWGSCGFRFRTRHWQLGYAVEILRDGAGLQHGLGLGYAP
jgi:hypothetical protein